MTESSKFSSILYISPFTESAIISENMSQCESITTSQIGPFIHDLVLPPTIQEIETNVSANDSGYSELETAILTAKKPLQINHSEIIDLNGTVGVFVNKNEVEHWTGDIPLSNYKINEDHDPIVIRKPADHTVVYDHDIVIRHLRPPTPPPPGEIILKQERGVIPPPAPPVVIRQQPPRPETPQPIIIREAPPTPPPRVEPTVISVPGKVLEPAPRKVVVERFGNLPDKPNPLIIERWLPYEEQKRKVVYVKPSEPEPVAQKPKNLIIEWDAPKVVVNRQIKDFGIIRADPNEYKQRYGATLKTANELPAFIKSIEPPNSPITKQKPNNTIYELEGDIEALKLIDLDAHGLSDYKNLINQYIH
jgi:hypothetical protein